MAIINDAKMEAAPLPNVTSGQPHLSRQDLTNLDITKLTPLSPEVISRQATIDIGTIGHPMGSQLSSRHCLVFILAESFEACLTVRWDTTSALSQSKMRHLSQMAYLTLISIFVFDMIVLFDVRCEIPSTNDWTFFATRNCWWNIVMFL